MLVRLEADAGRIEVTFPYFISKTAPVSGVESLMDYAVTLTGEVRDGQSRLWLTALVPVTSLCPCSKKISQYGAHNQRSHITMRVELAGDLPVEALVRMAEEEASCELWGLLKRPDEKFVTERAYENPEVRRRPRARHRDAAQRRYADRCVHAGSGEFRVHPQSQRLCRDRARQAAARLSASSPRKSHPRELTP